MGRGSRSKNIAGYNNKDQTYTSGTGQVIVNIHEEAEICHTEGCIIHAPSNHCMDDLPTHLRSSGLMERICEHGIGHPDPDSVAYFIRMGITTMGVHGCDGCCSEQARLERDSNK